MMEEPLHFIPPPVTTVHSNIIIISQLPYFSDGFFLRIFFSLLLYAILISHYLSTHLTQMYTFLRRTIK